MLWAVNLFITSNEKKALYTRVYSHSHRQSLYVLNTFVLFKPFFSKNKFVQPKEAYPWAPSNTYAICPI